MGVLYADIKTDSIITRSNHFLQLLRRACFVLVAFCPIVEITLSTQIIINLYMALFFNIFIGNNHPYIQRNRNRTELFNEVTIFYATFSLFLFTDFIETAETQNTCGWLIISVVLINMLVNWGLFLKETLGKLLRSIVKRLTRKSLKINKRKVIDIQQPTNDKQIENKQNSTLNIL